MLIAVAGPYSADSAEQRQRNLDALNKAAVEVLRLGHIPIIGVKAALAVVEHLEADRYEATMAISLLVEKCEGRNPCHPAGSAGASPAMSEAND